MTWGSVLIANVSGIDTDDGKFFGVVLLVGAVLTWWRYARSNRINGVLCVMAWMGLVGIAVAEIVHLSSNQYVSVGTGLYVDAVAATVGLVTAVMDMLARKANSRGPGSRQGTDGRWYPLAQQQGLLAAQPPPPDGRAVSPSRGSYGLQILTLLLAVVGLLTAVAGFSVFYWGKDANQWCNTQVKNGNFDNSYVCNPSTEHIGFIVFLGGLLILALFMVLFFVVRRKVYRP
jgi:hypothetical protein